MPDWKKFIEGKVVLAQKAKLIGNPEGKANADAHVPAGQKSQLFPSLGFRH